MEIYDIETAVLTLQETNGENLRVEKCVKYKGNADIKALLASIFQFFVNCYRKEWIQEFLMGGGGLTLFQKKSDDIWVSTHSQVPCACKKNKEVCPKFFKNKRGHIPGGSHP